MTPDNRPVFQTVVSMSIPADREALHDARGVLGKSMAPYIVNEDTLHDALKFAAEAGNNSVVHRSPGPATETFNWGFGLTKRGDIVVFVTDHNSVSARQDPDQEHDPIKELAKEALASLPEKQQDKLADIPDDIIDILPEGSFGMGLMAAIPDKFYIGPEFAEDGETVVGNLVAGTFKLAA